MCACKSKSNNKHISTPFSFLTHLVSIERAECAVCASNTHLSLCDCVTAPHIHIPLCVRPTDTGPYSALIHVCFANPVHPVSGTRSPVTTHSELSSQIRSSQGSFIFRRVTDPFELPAFVFSGSGALLKWMFVLFGKETLKMLGGWAPKKKPHSDSYSWVRSRGRAHW